MSQQVAIRIFKGDAFRGLAEWPSDRSVILGRQLTADEMLYNLNSIDGVEHIAFTNNAALNYSRSHLELSWLPDAKLQIKNISNSPLRVTVHPHKILDKQDSIEQILPTEIYIGDYRILVERSLNSLSRQTRFVKDFDAIDEDSMVAISRADSMDNLDELLQQLTAANSVLLLADSKELLYKQAVEAIKRLLQMDGVAIIDANNFQDCYCVEPVVPSISALEEIRSSKQVRWTPVEKNVDTVESQIELESFIGGPIMDVEDEVVAILYAHRDLLGGDTAVPRPALSKTMAQVFEMIACSVASGLNRISNEDTKKRFEAFFPKSLAEKLMVNDNILEPCVRDISVMFCDIRKFSSISQKLKPEVVSRWIQDVMTRLSACVHNHDGVVVDFIGDELMAMWGAPDELDNHATLACECANSMIKMMPEISHLWRDVIGDDTRFGIGICSGSANVGNTGSSNRFKYGPLGDTVNRASRVQGLTKFLGVDAILTGGTKRALNQGFMLRRLGKAKVVNIDETLELYELLSDEGSKGCYQGFENALSELENGNLESAAQLLKSLDFATPDHPSLLMLNQIIERVLDKKTDGDFIWDFKSK